MARRITTKVSSTRGKGPRAWGESKSPLMGSIQGLLLRRSFGRQMGSEAPDILGPDTYVTWNSFEGGLFAAPINPLGFSFPCPPPTTS